MGAGRMKFNTKLYLPNDGADTGTGADGAGAGGGGGAGGGDGDKGAGAGNAGGKDSKRDPAYENLPDDHPLVKRLEAQKQTIAELKPKAKIVDEAAEAKKTDAEKIAGLQAKLDAQPKAVAESLREHLVALHEIPKERAELFLTGDTPELMLRQVTALLEDSGTGGPKRKNYVNKEGNSNGKPSAGSENAKFASSLFGGGDDD